MTKFKNPDGFSAIHVALALVAVGIIGFTSWYVFRAQHDTNKSAHATSANASNTKKSSTKKSQVQPTPSPNQTTIASAQYPKVATPESCDNFQLDTSGPSPTSLEAVKTGMLGQWIGCTTNPWTSPYKVSFEFRPDGTYSSETLADSGSKPALYYGTDQDSPKKTYSIDNFLGNGRAQGTIVIYFAGTNTTNTDTLDNISLTGNTLSFSFKHFGQYGPLVYDLVRVNQQ